MSITNRVGLCFDDVVKEVPPFHETFLVLNDHLGEVLGQLEVDRAGDDLGDGVREGQGSCLAGRPDHRLHRVVDVVALGKKDHESEVEVFWGCFEVDGHLVHHAHDNGSNMVGNREVTSVGNTIWPWRGTFRMQKPVKGHSFAKLPIHSRKILWYTSKKEIHGLGHSPLFLEDFDPVLLEVASSSTKAGRGGICIRALRGMNGSKANFPALLPPALR